MQFLEKSKPVALLVLRVAVGVVFIGHGYEKLSDIPHFLREFPGYGFPSYFAYIAAYLEVVGGGLLILGLFTRGISLIFVIEMVLVLGRTLLPQSGIFGYKLYQVALLLCAGALALAGKAKADEPGAEAKPAETPEHHAEPAKPTEHASETPGTKPPTSPPPSAIHFPVLKAGEYDDKKMWKALKVKKPHKFVFESVAPHLIVPGLTSLYIHVQNALNSGEFSMGWGKGKVGSAAVLLGPSAEIVCCWT